MWKIEDYIGIVGILACISGSCIVLVAARSLCLGLLEGMTELSERINKLEEKVGD